MKRKITKEISDSCSRWLKLGLLHEDALVATYKQIEYLEDRGAKNNDDLCAAFSDIRLLREDYQMDSLTRGISAEDSARITQDIYNSIVSKFNKYVILPLKESTSDTGEIISADENNRNQDQKFFRSAHKEVTRAPSTAPELHDTEPVAAINLGNKRDASR